MAVLPFVNMSSDPEQEFFSDGMTEDLITSLSCYRSFSVIARNSTAVYKGQSADVRQIANDLGASYILQGSIRKSGARVRVSAQLIDAVYGNHIWAERYDRKVDDIFDLQDEIVETISGRLGPEVDATEMRRAELKSTRNLDAWGCYHLGMLEFFRFNEDGNKQAQHLMRRAIELDPKFGPPYARLAYAALLGMIYFDTEPTVEAFDETIAHARKAVEIDAKDAWSHMALGKVHLLQCDYESALAESRIAVQLNPSLGVAHCGIADALTYMGFVEDAIPQFETAIRLSPQDPWRWAFFAYRSLAHLFREEYDAAVYWAGSALRVPNCAYWANAHMVSALGHLGMKDKGNGAAAELLRRKPRFSCEYAKQRLFYVKDAGQLARYLDGLRKAGLP
ncbi:MAG: adenylate cyclase [Gammaproteobacteria bacterium]